MEDERECQERDQERERAGREGQRERVRRERAEEKGKVRKEAQIAYFTQGTASFKKYTWHMS